MYRTNKLEARNSKSETDSNESIIKFKIPFVLVIGILDFGIVSNFDIRISDFRIKDFS